MADADWRSGIGGVGSGLYGMLLFVMLAVFIAGLMVGRTPEYLGKKIDVREMKMIALAILVAPDAGAAWHGAGDDDRRRPRRDVEPWTARLWRSAIRRHLGGQ